MFEDRRTALLFPGAGQSLVAQEDGKNHKVESQTPGLFFALGLYLWYIRGDLHLSVRPLDNVF